MTKEELKELKNNLILLKADIEWDKPLSYQIDLDMAIECVEKQIPKKPNIVGKTTMHFECPVCGQPLSHRRGCENNKCRQCIDWEW